MFLLRKIFPYSYFIKARIYFQKNSIFDFRRLKNARSSVFSSISFAAIFLVILFANSIFCNLSLHSVAEIEVSSKVLHPRKIHHPLLSLKAETSTKAGPAENSNGLIMPSNLTKEERITWFRRKLPEIEIFKSTKLTRQFDDRVKGFFNHECKGQFFMTWIAPVTSFGKREFFAMESLFKANPQGCLMLLSSTMDSTHGFRILKPLHIHGFKVLAVTPDVSFLFKDTPAETWLADMKSGKKDPGRIPLAQNLSNVIRLLVLYKYGGIYLDMDVIVLRNFSDLRNSIGAQSMDRKTKIWTRLNNAAMIFDKNHPLLYKFIEEFASTFDGNKWGHNGPYLVSRVVRGLERSPDFHIRPDFNFTVLPPKAFYPADWVVIRKYFKKPENKVESKWVETKQVVLNQKTYGIHLWNKHSKLLRIQEGSLIGKIISDHCVICKDVYSS